MIDYKTAFTNTDDVAFPNTKAVNVTAPGSGDGTEFVAAMVNDIWGRSQALMSYAGLTPDGVTEAPATSQFLAAMMKGFALGPGYRVMYDKAGSPATNGDRVLLLQGQVIAIASYPLLAAAVYVGDGTNATAPCYYKTSDAGGTTRSTAGGYLVLPDHRAVSPKGAGNQTINTRVKTGPVFGAVEEDQFHEHLHRFKKKNGSTANEEWNSTQYPAGGHYGSALFGFATTNEFNDVVVGVPIASGANGTPRMGLTTRDCTIGTNFGITY